MMHSLVHRVADDRPPTIPLLTKGFRPLFLCAAVYAVLAVPLFLLTITGRAGAGSYLPSMYWHAHEMVFGFSVAVLGGFLLTAIANWTSRPTAEGGRLAVLVVLWGLGRIGILAADRLPRFVPAVLDLAFLPALVVACAGPIVAARNRRNYGFVVLLGALFAANAAVHGAALGFLPPAHQRNGSWVGTDILVVAMVVMTGRVVPMFARNALGAPDVRATPLLEQLTTISVITIVLLEAFVAAPNATGLVSCLAGLLAVLRMRRWGTLRVLREPLLWILHIGSLWIAVGLVLRGLATFSVLPLGCGLHALTAGAVGALTLGMMTRVGLGHTGRMLVVPPRITGAFGAVVAGAALRVLAPLLWPGAVAPLVVAGLLWSTAFLIYLLSHAPLLVSPRVDGRPG
jgi:uncharacterized protein involved in response to NO